MLFNLKYSWTDYFIFLFLKTYKIKLVFTYVKNSVYKSSKIKFSLILTLQSVILGRKNSFPWYILTTAVWCKFL